MEDLPEEFTGESFPVMHIISSPIGSNHGRSCSSCFRLEVEAMQSSSVLPPSEGDNGTRLLDRRGDDWESLDSNCNSRVSACKPHGELLSTRKCFLAEPLHAAAAPTDTPQLQKCSVTPMASDERQTDRRRSSAEERLSTHSSSRETDTEAEADNPLLPLHNRKGKKRGSSASVRSRNDQRGVFQRNSSAASGIKGESTIEMQEGGRSSITKRAVFSCPAEPPMTEEMTTYKEDGEHRARLDELSLLSFNAGLLEYKLCGLRVYQNPPFTQRRLHHIPEAPSIASVVWSGVRSAALLATGADIICLQEVYREAHADFIIENTRHRLPFVGRRTSGGRFSLHNGLMVLSKYPIVHTQFHKFEDVTYIERCFASKGMLEVAVDVPSIGVVAIFNIHLASGAVDPESRYVEDVRAAEIRQLLKACDAAADKGLVPIIIGDLNAAPHLCASNYKCFVERGWRDCWLHVHGHQRHLLQHHLLHQQQLLDEQQLDDQGIELHDRHIRRDLFVRIRRQRRMQLLHGIEPVALERLPQTELSENASRREQGCRSRALQCSFDRGRALDTDRSDVEGKEQSFPSLQRHGTQTLTRSLSSANEPIACSSNTYQSASQHPGHTVKFAGTGAVGDCSGGDSSESTIHRVFLASNSSSPAVENAVPRSWSNSGGAANGLLEGESRPLPMTGLLGGYFGRAGGGVQLPLAFELPAAAAWAHREFFLTAKRRLIEQQRKWLGGGDKAPVLDLRLSLATPQHRQRGVDATPLASDCSLASCSTALTAAQSSDTALVPAAKWRFGGPTSALTHTHWQGGADGSVADWMLSDTDEEADTEEAHDVVIQCGSQADEVDNVSCSRRDFTWDPENPLNSIGPHAGCHGLRCDYVFLPPHHFAGGLYPFLPVAADILLRDPRVLVDACCFGCFGDVMLVTLSDHYAVRITLRRSADADIADFWGSCAAEAAAALRPDAVSHGNEPDATTVAGTVEGN